MTPWLLLIALYVVGLPMAATCAEYIDPRMTGFERKTFAALWPVLALVYCLFAVADCIAVGINSDEDHE